MPWDAIYSALNINVSRGLRPNGRINYSCAYQGTEAAEILRLLDRAVEKNLCHGCTIPS